MSEKNTKTGFTVLQLVEIPNTYLRETVLKELSGRALYIDTTGETIPPEEIYSGDVFEEIACEYKKLPENSPLRKLDEEDLKQIDELAEELGQYELVRINTI